MNFPRGIRADTKTAFEMYHMFTAFKTSDIRNLFACGASSANKIKKIAIEEMAKEGVKLYSEDRNLVDKDVLYKIAGIDINKVNRSYKMLRNMEIQK